MVRRQDASTGEMIDDGVAAQSTAAKAGDKATTHVKVYSPYRVYFDNDAYSISGENVTGPFDILPHHHSFITLLKPCDLHIRAVEGGEMTVRISGGIMHVKADKVSVFLQV